MLLVNEDFFPDITSTPSKAELKSENSDIKNNLFEDFSINNEVTNEGSSDIWSASKRLPGSLIGNSEEDKSFSSNIQNNSGVNSTMNAAEVLVSMRKAPRIIQINLGNDNLYM